MRSIRNFMGALIIGAFALAAPMGHDAMACGSHGKTTKHKTTHKTSSAIHHTALRRTTPHHHALRTASLTSSNANCGCSNTNSTTSYNGTSTYMTPDGTVRTFSTADNGYTNSGTYNSSNGVALDENGNVLSGTPLTGTGPLSLSNNGTQIVDPTNGTAAIPDQPVEEQTLGTKVARHWQNLKHKVAYDTYRLTHSGTSAEEQAQDAAHEAADRAHEQQYQQATSQPSR